MKEKILQTKCTPQFKYFTVYATIVVSLTLAGIIVIFKEIPFYGLLFSGGSFTLVAWYILMDGCAEVYGYKMAKQLLIATMVTSIVFSLVIVGIIHLPSGNYSEHQKILKSLFDTLPSTAFGVTIGLIFSGVINIYLVSRWKVLIKGKYFWMRSIGASSISETVFLIVIALAVLIWHLPLSQVFLIIVSTLLFRFVCTIIFVWPVAVLVYILKRAEGIDIYDHNLKFNPFLIGDDTSSSSLPK